MFDFVIFCENRKVLGELQRSCKRVKPSFLGQNPMGGTTTPPIGCFVLCDLAYNVDATLTPIQHNDNILSTLFFWR